MENVQPSLNDKNIEDPEISHDAVIAVRRK